jgi:ornithine cyclodeaminase/alanine dehydrogenase
VLILSEKDLRSLLVMRDCIRAVEQGFSALAEGKALAPERMVMSLAGGVFLEMPSAMESEKQNAFGTKIVSVFEKNSERDLATVQAVYLLLDGETGEPLSLMEGRLITALRTAAVSAVATKFMMAEGADRLAIIGAGVQGRFHLEAMAEVARFSEVLIASRSEEKARSLAEEAREIFDAPCKAATVEEAARCQVICACTTSPAPLFAGRLLRAGAHINAVGAFTPQTRELDTETIARSRVIIDDHTAAGREAGELLIPISEGVITYDHIKGTLADVVSGRVKGRESADEITLFKSCGLAIEDLVAARLAYEKAVETGAGAQVDL